jgi:hypothetical protein
MSESHYLTCQDENCEKAYCVARRDYEAKLSGLERKNRVLQVKIDNLIVGNLNDFTEMELKVVKHHRDELLTEIKLLKNILKKK